MILIGLNKKGKGKHPDTAARGTSKPHPESIRQSQRALPAEDFHHSLLELVSGHPALSHITAWTPMLQGEGESPGAMGPRESRLLYIIDHINDIWDSYCVILCWVYTSIVTAIVLFYVGSAGPGYPMTIALRNQHENDSPLFLQQ